MKEQSNNDQACKLEIKSYISQILVQEPQDVSSEDEKVKQEFLKRQIFDHYSQQEDILIQFYQYFIAFALKNKQRKIDQPDLRIFTMAEIKQMIEQFKQELKKNDFKQEEKEIKLPNLPNVAQSFINQESFTKTFYKNGAWDYELMIKQMNCSVEMSIFQSSNQKIKIKFKNHFIKKDRGFFGIGSKLTLWIQLQTQFLQRRVTVDRSIEDFIMLQRTLRKIYPHSFIPTLKISLQETKAISEQSNQIIITKCFNFLNKITKRPQLLENVHMFRFVAEEIYPNYIIQRNNSLRIKIRNLAEFKNNRGVVSIRVSETTEQKKKDCLYKGYVFQKIWTTVDKLMAESTKHSQELTNYLSIINDQFSLLVKQTLTGQNAKNISEQCIPFAKLLSSTQDVIKMYIKIIEESQSFVLHLKNQFIRKARIDWGQFNRYKEKIIQSSEIYQTKRKSFLQKQAEKLKLGENNIKNGPSNLKISDLNLEQSVAQQAWAQKQTAWYGYMNHEFISTFKSFLKRDRAKYDDQLKKIGLLKVKESEEGINEIIKTLREQFQIDL